MKMNNKPFSLFCIRRKCVPPVGTFVLHKIYHLIEVLISAPPHPTPSEAESCAAGDRAHLIGCPVLLNIALAFKHTLRMLGKQDFHKRS